MAFNNWRLHVASRYSVSSTSDHLVSFISFISITGLVLGVAVLVIVLSVMNGFEEELRLRVLGVVPHGVIYSRGSSVADWETMKLEMESHPDVAAVAPLVEGSGLVLANRELVGVSFSGVEPTQEQNVSIVQDYFVQGGLSTLEDGAFNVVMGETLAARLNVLLGDKVTLVLGDIRIGLVGPMPVTKRFTVTGLFKVGSDLDKSQIFIHIVDAQKIKKQKDIDGLRVRTLDLFSAPRILHELILSSSEKELYAFSWMRRHGNLYDAIQMQKTTMFLLLLMLVAVAAFNVVSNLMMTVQDKYADIAILRTIGASPGAIRTIFVLHGTIVGVVGVSIGIILGAIIATWLGEIYRFVDQSLGLGLMDEYFIQYLPTRVLATDIAVVGSVSFLICLLATIYPASKAAAANPVEALQHGI
jgi:lipoprotein-releasing system permease protein